MSERKKEIEEDDTSGREIRHGEFFTHLNLLIEQINIISQPSERTQQAQRRAAQRETIRTNLMRNLGDKRRADEALSDYEDEDTESTHRVSERGEISSRSGASSSSTHSSQKERRNAAMTSRAVDNLAVATLESARVVAAAIREPHTFTTASSAKTVTRAKLHEIVNQMRDETGQCFMAMERKQDEYQNEVLSLLRGLAARGVSKRGREQ